MKRGHVGCERRAKVTRLVSGASLLLLLLGVCASTQAQTQAEDQAHATGLAELLREVRARSPTREAAHLRLNAAHNELAGAGRPGDPMISIETDGWGSAQEGGERMIRYSLEQPIPIPGSLRAEERVAEAGIDRATSALQTALRALELETIRAYAMLWQVQGELAVVQSQRALLEDLAGTALARMRAGADAHHDVIQAQVQGLALQNRATVLESERVSAAAMLNALRNRPLSTPVVAVGLGLPDSLADERTLLRRGLRDRPELLSMRAMAREERAMAGLMRIDSWPMLRAGIWYTQDLDMPDSVGVMFAATVPIFGAPRGLARADAAAARAGAADQDRARMEAMIYAEVHGARARYAAAVERLSLLRDVALPRAEEALLASQTSYRAGMMSFASLIQDRQMLAELRMELIGAQAARLIAWGDLLHAIGADITAEVPR